MAGWVHWVAKGKCVSTLSSNHQRVNAFILNQRAVMRGGSFLYIPVGISGDAGSCLSPSVYIIDPAMRKLGRIRPLGHAAYVEAAQWIRDCSDVLGALSNAPDDAPF